MTRSVGPPGSASLTLTHQKYLGPAGAAGGTFETGHHQRGETLFGPRGAWGGGGAIRRVSGSFQSCVSSKGFVGFYKSVADVPSWEGYMLLKG